MRDIDNLKCMVGCEIAGCWIEEGEILTRDDLVELGELEVMILDSLFVSKLEPARSALLRVEPGDGRWFVVKAKLTGTRGDLEANFNRKKKARERAVDELKRVELLGEVRFVSGQNVECLIEEFGCYKRDVKGLPHAPTFRKYLVSKGLGNWIEQEDEAPGPSDHGDGSSSKVLNLSAPAATIRRMMKMACQTGDNPPTYDMIGNEHGFDRHTIAAAFQELEAQGIVFQDVQRRWRLKGTLPT